MKDEYLFPCLQKPAVGPYPEPYENTPYPHTPLFRIYFNIVFPSTPRPPIYSLLFAVFDKNYVCIYYLSHAFNTHTFSYKTGMHNFL
jgi:hypothetical protein